MTWSRENDAWLAKHCEGWEMKLCQPGRMSMDWYAWNKATERWVRLPHYITDPAACIRAAEAWRKKDPDVDRTVHLNSAIERGEVPFRAECHENYRVVDERGERYAWRVFHGESKEGYAAALAQALLRATGGAE